MCSWGGFEIIECANFVVVCVVCQFLKLLKQETKIPLNNKDTTKKANICVNSHTNTHKPMHTTKYNHIQPHIHACIHTTIHKRTKPPTSTHTQTFKKWVWTGLGEGGLGWMKVWVKTGGEGRVGVTFLLDADWLVQVWFILIEILIFF